MRGLIEKMWSVGLVAFRSKLRCSVGLSTVVQKDDLLRLEVDCRLVNCCHRAPPCTTLATAGALCSLDLSDSHLDVEGHSERGRPLGVCVFS
jgi:hypothetical protein